MIYKIADDVQNLHASRSYSVLQQKLTFFANFFSTNSGLCECHINVNILPSVYTEFFFLVNK